MLLSHISLSARGGDMIAAFKAIGRSIFSGFTIGNEASIRPSARTAIAAFVFALAIVPAHAQQQFVTFESVLSTPAATSCIDIPQAQYVAGNQLEIANCTGAPEQTFGSNDAANLTAAGFCVDAQPPSEGGPVLLNQCNGTDQQVWYLVPFSSSPDVYAIEDSSGLCVTINGDAAPGTQLALAPCQEFAVQGWVFYAQPTPSPPVYGAYSEPVYYWIGEQRYCWYDNGGWNGPGWYVCGQFGIPGQGWGGPGGFPTVAPTVPPTMAPTVPPTVPPTVLPTVPPTLKPTILPTLKPTILPTLKPTIPPTIKPTVLPTLKPTVLPTLKPTIPPTLTPTLKPTIKPTILPTISPTLVPTLAPTLKPTLAPTLAPTVAPTIKPTLTPTVLPTLTPTIKPTIAPTVPPTIEPTLTPTIKPTIAPTVPPTIEPTLTPTIKPTVTPTVTPTIEPTLTPTIKPTGSPTGLLVKPLKETTKPTPITKPTLTTKPTLRRTTRPPAPTGGGKPPAPPKNTGNDKDRK